MAYYEFAVSREMHEAVKALAAEERRPVTEVLRALINEALPRHVLNVAEEKQEMRRETIRDRAAIERRRQGLFDALPAEGSFTAYVGSIQSLQDQKRSAATQYFMRNVRPLLVRDPVTRMYRKP